MKLRRFLVANRTSEVPAGSPIPGGTFGQAVVLAKDPGRMTAMHLPARPDGRTVPVARHDGLLYYRLL